MRLSGLILFAVSCFAAFPQTASGPSPKLEQPAAKVETIAKAGGVELALPGPTSFTEVGDELRTTFFDLLVPATNRLVTAYVPTQMLAALKGGKAMGGLSLYALAEVPRRAEYAD